MSKFYAVDGLPVASLADTKKPKPFQVLAGTYSFVYDYPLRKPARFKHPLTGQEGLYDIMYLAARDYEKIYTHDAKYEIWGHDIGDLVFEGVTVDDKNRTISFSIGS